METTRSASFWQTILLLFIFEFKESEGQTSDLFVYLLVSKRYLKVRLVYTRQFFDKN